MTATYREMKKLTCCLIDTMEILSGNDMGSSDKTWQFYATDAAILCEKIASQLREAAAGNCESFVTFPSIVEFCEEERTMCNEDV
jgi:hypothetical protein